MAIRNLAQITCSLNLGLIYSLDYDYSPDNGATIRLFFVSQNGTYREPRGGEKAQIRVGAASFSMYVLRSQIQLSSGRRVMEVTFVDDTFRLNNYMVTLTGRGCGFNVYELGENVDTRTPEEKRADALDPDAQQIAELTQFPDVEYSFNDFLTVLRRHFAVQVNAFYDADITNAYSGTFREVLDSWCALFNLSWYIENSVIKVFDPTKLTINLPTESSINDLISYESLTDWESTYGKTCANWFQQEGGQYSLNQTSNDDGSLLVRTDTLFPAGYDSRLEQPAIDLNQVAAAQYGEQFWFLYNYVKGTTAQQCGWTPVTPTTPQQSQTNQSILAAGGGIVVQNNDVFQGRFDAYYTYGQSIAGRWYLSNEKSEVATDAQYTWFDESEGQIFSFTNVDDKAISLEFATPVGTATQKIPETIINSYYPGVNYVGNRIIYRDTTPISGDFSIGSAPVGAAYQSIFEIPGSQSFDFSAFANLATGANVIIAYNPNYEVPTSIRNLINDIPSKVGVFAPRFTSIPIKGITTLDYSTLKTSQTEQDGIDIVNDEGPTVVSNTAVIKTLKQGAYTAYYDKYSKCASAHTTGPYFGHRFEMRQISSDNEIGVSFSKPAPNVYKITRDYGLVDSLVNNPLLPQMAQGRTFPTRRVSFTVNYFYDVPTNFLTNGLVGLSLSIGDNGVTATYSYSNEVLQVPDPSNQFERFEQMMRNSWIRQYRPNQVIS